MDGHERTFLNLTASLSRSSHKVSVLMAMSHLCSTMSLEAIVSIEIGHSCSQSDVSGTLCGNEVIAWINSHETVHGDPNTAISFTWDNL